MLNQFGFDCAQWDAAKEQAKGVLTAAASRKGRVFYSELVGQISALDLEPYDSRLFHLLGEISTEEAAAGRGMLTAIVVHKYGEMLPGQGFFELAKSLGRNVKDPVAFWVSEFSKVHDYWGNRNSGV